MFFEKGVFMRKKELLKLLKSLDPQEVANILGIDFLRTLVSQLSPIEKAELFGRSRLSDRAIIQAIKEGRIIIDPFEEKNLGNSNYDVRLGPNYFAAQETKGGPQILNILDPTHVKRVWGRPQKAKTVSEFLRIIGDIPKLKNFKIDDLVIAIEPLGSCLTHTIEFIGGRENITTYMKARSGMGRSFIEVCKCAGEGDIGYFGRWTMEFTNNSKDRWIVLKVGMRVAQIAFIETVPPKNASYVQRGRYQTSNRLEKLKKSWRPEDMLPKIHKDQEVVEGINPINYTQLNLFS